MIKGGRINAIQQTCKGCFYTRKCTEAAISIAKGLKIEEALHITQNNIEKKVGGLPEDHKHCASLALNSLVEALSNFHKSNI